LFLQFTVFIGFILCHREYHVSAPLGPILNKNQQNHMQKRIAKDPMPTHGQRPTIIMIDVERSLYSGSNTVVSALGRDVPSPCSEDSVLARA
jgi:hypothetical protein